MDQIHELVQQHLQAARAYLDECGGPYTQQRVYRVAMRLLVSKLWCGTQTEHERYVVAISLINRRWADFRSTSGESIETDPLYWPAPDIMAALPALAVQGGTPGKCEHMPHTGYRDNGDGVAELLLALDAGTARGLSGYAREIWAGQLLQGQQDLFTDRCCEAHLPLTARERAWHERRKRQQARCLLTDLRQGRVTEAELRRIYAAPSPAAGSRDLNNKGAL